MPLRERGHPANGGSQAAGSPIQTRRPFRDEGGKETSLFGSSRGFQD
jgi:hypothetical protein